MFKFTHTEQELRDIIQAIEAKIASLQAHLQKLVTTANEQALIRNGRPDTATAATNADSSVGETDAASVDSASADAGTTPAAN